jgi:FHS family glucose/mannose:H+ symporter-like MFS transporter
MSNKLKIILTFIGLSLISTGMPVFVMQAINYYHISQNSAGTLELFSDFPKLIASFIMFTILIKVGFRRSLILTYIVFILVCLIVPFINTINSLRAYIIISGLVFVIIKIIAYSSVGLVTKNDREHASLINLMEALYTTGSIIGLWLYSGFIHIMPEEWNRVFWAFAGVSLLLLIMWFFTKFDESQIEKQEELPLIEQFKGIGFLLNRGFLIFALLLASYETLEMGIGSWLPYFNSGILELPEALSIQIASFLAIGIALGRFAGTFILRYVKWYKMFAVSLVIAIVLTALILSNIHHGVGKDVQSIFNAPLIAFGIPLLGFFIGPIYPTLASLLLTSTPKAQHALITSVIMVLCAIFDSGSAKIIGVLFDGMGGIKAFAFATLIPLGILLLFLFPYKNSTRERIAKEV